MNIFLLDMSPESRHPLGGYTKTKDILTRNTPTLQITTNSILARIIDIHAIVGEVVIFHYKAGGREIDKCLSAESPITQLNISSTSVCGDVYIRTKQQSQPIELTFPFPITDTVKDDCCFLKLSVSFDQCSVEKSNSKYFARVLSVRNALVHRSDLVFNNSKYDEFSESLQLNNTDYLFGSFTVEYDVTAETGNFELFLPHQHQTRILIANNDNPACQINVSFTYQTYSSVHVTNNKKSKINGSEICLEETCYSFSVVKNVSWDEASQLCERKGLSLPQFHTASQLSSLLVASLEYIDYGSVIRSAMKRATSREEEGRKYMWNLYDHIFCYAPLLDLGKNLVHTGGTLIGSHFMYIAGRWGKVNI